MNHILGKSQSQNCVLLSHNIQQHGSYKLLQPRAQENEEGQYLKRMHIHNCTQWQLCWSQLAVVVLVMLLLLYKTGKMKQFSTSTSAWQKYKIWAKFHNLASLTLLYFFFFFFFMHCLEQLPVLLRSPIVLCAGRSSHIFLQTAFILVFI